MQTCTPCCASATAWRRETIGPPCAAESDATSVLRRTLKCPPLALAVGIDARWECNDCSGDLVRPSSLPLEESLLHFRNSLDVFGSYVAITTAASLFVFEKVEKPPRAVIRALGAAAIAGDDVSTKRASEPTRANPVRE